MKKLFQNQVVAWVVLVLAVVLACAWGQMRKGTYESKKSTELLEVKYYEWVNDSAKLLSDTTENTVKQYNTSWNDKYYSVVAVATVSKLNGWTEEDYTRALGEKWGLGAGDMLLLLVKNGDWYVACGDNVLNTMTDTQQTKLKQALDEPYYQGKFDAAVTAFFRQADVFYAQAGISGGGGSGNTGTQWTEYQQPQSGSHVSIFKVILLIVAIFVVWAIIDRIRYGRYRRRAVVGTVPTVSYYPIFWGRPARVAAPAAPRPVASPTSGVYHSPSTPPRPGASNAQPTHGVRHNTVVTNARRPSTPTRPANTAKPSSSPRPGNFGKGGFGGGKR